MSLKFHTANKSSWPAAISRDAEHMHMSAPGAPGTAPLGLARGLVLQEQRECVETQIS